VVVVVFDSATRGRVCLLPFGRPRGRRTAVPFSLTCGDKNAFGGSGLSDVSVSISISGTLSISET